MFRHNISNIGQMGFVIRKMDALVVEKAKVPVVSLSREYNSLSSEPHSHACGQLYYCEKGLIKVKTSSAVWVVSPQRAVWIPQGVVHQSTSKQNVSLRNLYIKQKNYSGLPVDVCMVQVSPLLRELIYAAIEQGNNWSSNSKESRLSRVMVDKVISAPKEILCLPLPRDPRALAVCERMQKKPQLHIDVSKLCLRAGLSPRTLVRILHDETKMNLQQWKQQLLIMTAIEMMNKNKNITTIAMDLGYASPSAFIAMFRKTLGVSPSEYFFG